MKVVDWSVHTMFSPWIHPIIIIPWRNCIVWKVSWKFRDIFVVTNAETGINSGRRILCSLFHDSARMRASFFVKLPTGIWHNLATDFSHLSCKLLDLIYGSDWECIWCSRKDLSKLNTMFRRSFPAPVCTCRCTQFWCLGCETSELKSGVNSGFELLFVTCSCPVQYLMKDGTNKHTITWNGF